MVGTCAVCGAAATARCGQCRGPWYCGREHQREHWRSHRAECRHAAGGGGEAGFGAAGSARSAGAAAGMTAPPASQWAVGMSEREQHEWLVDCYRMRLDDDYAWGGCYLHGLYDPEHTPLTVVLDFLVFCKLAVEKGALPDRWRWAPFLDVAAGELLYAFEKSDAQEKYGRENVFAAMTGGRSLRFTGEVIMGSGIMEQKQSKEDRRLRKRVERFGHALNGDDAFFNDVGGVALWRKLLGALETRSRQQ